MLSKGVDRCVILSHLLDLVQWLLDSMHALLRCVVVLPVGCPAHCTATYRGSGKSACGGTCCSACPKPQEPVLGRCPTPDGCADGTTRSSTGRHRGYPCSLRLGCHRVGASQG